MTKRTDAMDVSTAIAAGYGNEEAMARAVQSDPFEHIVHRYHRPVTAFIYRMVGDYETALDLTQEVFLKVYAALDRYDERFKFSTWLFKIASNHTIDYLRKQTHRTHSLDAVEENSEIHPPELISPEPSPERQSILRERRALIEAAIAELPLPYRQVIVLRHVAELSYEEIAQVTGLPLGTVKNRIFRAREAIRKKLIRMGIDGTE